VHNGLVPLDSTKRALGFAASALALVLFAGCSGELASLSAEAGADEVDAAGGSALDAFVGMTSSADASTASSVDARSIPLADANALLDADSTAPTDSSAVADADAITEGDSSIVTQSDAQGAPDAFVADVSVEGADVSVGDVEAPDDANEAADGSAVLPRAFVKVALEDPLSGTCIAPGMQLVLAGSESQGLAVRAPSSDVITIACQVVYADARAGFDFSAQTDHTPQPDGQAGLNIFAQVDANGYASNVYADLDFGRDYYAESDCTITPTFDLTSSLPPAPPSVALGRIFGHLECPNAAGALAGDECGFQADFVFEDCAPY
jgi:hypothetical protein